MTDASLAPAPDTPIAADAARPLKLLAMEPDDLVVVSAVAQDAIAKPVEMRRMKAEGAFVMVLDRLAREQGAERTGLLRRRKLWQRRRAVLDFRTVRDVARRGFTGGDDEAMVLLAITHEPGAEPDEPGVTPDDAGASPDGAGASPDGARAAADTGSAAPDDTMTLHFAGGAEVRLTVEAIEVRLTDLGPAWNTDNTPDHR